MEVLIYNNTLLKIIQIKQLLPKFCQIFNIKLSSDG